MSHPSRPPPPRTGLGLASSPASKSQQGLKAAAGEVGGAAGSGGKKERRGEDEGTERGESRAELASLARLLAHRRPPALHPPAGSHRLHRRRSPGLVAAPACPRLLSHVAENRPARRAHERPSVARQQPAVPGARAQPPGRSRGPLGQGRARAADIQGERCSEHMAACAGLMGRVVLKDPRG